MATTAATIKCPGCGATVSVSATVQLDEDDEERAHYSVLNDGKGRWVVVDDRSDDPAPVYKTCEAAHRAIGQFIGEH